MTITGRQAGGLLRRRRRALGWNTIQFAKAVGVSPRTIGSYERDGPPPGKAEHLHRVLDERERELDVRANHARLRLLDAPLLDLLTAASHVALLREEKLHSQEEEIRDLRERLAKQAADTGGDQ